MVNADLVQHYRELRGLSGKIQDEALDLLPGIAMIEFGRRLGAVWHGKVALDDEGDMKLLYDFALHTSKNGRSRAIDRYAQKATFPPDSDGARMLHGLRTARFTMFKVLRRHEVAGVMARDTLQDLEFHFMDISIGLGSHPGDAFVGRLMDIDGYSMSCMSVLPLTTELAEATAKYVPWWRSDNQFSQFQDPRCAMAFYRAAIELGIMRQCINIDVEKVLPTEELINSINAINDHRSAGWPTLTAVR